MKIKLSKRLTFLIAGFLSLFLVNQLVYADNTATLLPGAPVQGVSMPATADQLKDTQKISLKGVRGEVYLQKNGSGKLEKLSRNSDIQIGDTIHAKEGTCNIYFDNYSYVVIFPNTDLVVTQAAIDKAKGTVSTDMRLETGRLKIKVNKLAEGSRFEVKTPTAVAAVRGTLFYLNAGSNLGRLFTELYVDESKGGVLFTHVKTLENFLVSTFNSSIATDDGSLLPPHALNPEQQQQFKDLWDKLISSYLAQEFGVEQLNTPPPGDLNQFNQTNNQGLLTDDALGDKKNEQNIFGQNQNGEPQDDSLAGDDPGTQLHNLLLGATDDLLQIGLNSLDDLIFSPESLAALLEKSEGLSFLVVEHNLLAQPNAQPSDDYEWAYSTVHDNRELGVVTADRVPVLIPVLNQYSVLSDQLDTLTGELNDLLGLGALLDGTPANDSALLAQAQTIINQFNLDAADAQNILTQFETLLHQAHGDMDALREFERNEIRQEIARIRNDVDFQHADANLEQISDAQTGKVFTDIHGNRVRVDEYIYHQPDSNTVEMLSLTLRAGDYQNGVSSIHLGVEFNRSLDSEVNLKSLPWADYFNVVTGDELVSRVYDDNFEASVHESGEFAPQYILHESNPGLAQGEGALYPTHFYAEFANPVREGNQRDKIRMDEVYGSPETVYFEGITSNDGSYVVQPLTAQSTLISPSEGDSLLILKKGNDMTPRLFLNSNIGYNPDTNCLYPALGDLGQETDLYLYVPLSQAQTPGFAENYFPGQLVGSNVAFLQYTPALTGDYMIYLDSHGVISQKILVNGFVPFDNEGKVLNQEGGFKVNGLRDLFSPNPLINNGHYNLEVLMVFGDVDTVTCEGPMFSEGFRIDTIITPEIFTPESGFDTVNHTSEFPASLSGESEPGGNYNT